MKKYPKNYKHYTKNEVDLVTFTEEILNGKLHFLCSEKNLFLFKTFGLVKIDISIFFFAEINCLEDHSFQDFRKNKQSRMYILILEINRVFFSKALLPLYYSPSPNFLLLMEYFNNYQGHNCYDTWRVF